MSSGQITYRLIDVGRSKVNRVVTVSSYGQLLREVKKHLASRLVEIGDDGFIYAGDRPVGRIEVEVTA